MAGESAQQKVARETSVEALDGLFQRLGPPRDQFGTPMIKISAAAAELVPTQQYGNATIGPVVVERYVPDAGDEALKLEVKKTMDMVEKAVAEDRDTLHQQLRAKAG